MAITRLDRKKKMAQDLVNKGFTFQEALKISSNFLDMLDLQRKVLKLLQENTQLLSKPKHERVKTRLLSKSYTPKSC